MYVGIGFFLGCLVTSFLIKRYDFLPYAVVFSFIVILIDLFIGG